MRSFPDLPNDRDSLEMLLKTTRDVIPKARPLQGILDEINFFFYQCSRGDFSAVAILRSLGESAIRRCHEVILLSATLSPYLQMPLVIPEQEGFDKQMALLQARINSGKATRKDNKRYCTSMMKCLSENKQEILSFIDVVQQLQGRMADLLNQQPGFAKNEAEGESETAEVRHGPEHWYHATDATPPDWDGTGHFAARKNSSVGG
jgi:hypothetical protein